MCSTVMIAAGSWTSLIVAESCATRFRNEMSLICAWSSISEHFNTYYICISFENVLSQTWTLNMQSFRENMDRSTSFCHLILHRHHGDWGQFSSCGREYLCFTFQYTDIRSTALWDWPAHSTIWIAIHDCSIPSFPTTGGYEEYR